MKKIIDNDHEIKVRLRRTKSVTRAEEIQRADYMERRSQPDKPCHRPRDSLFSWSSGFDNFTGFINWGFLLLGLGGVRLLLENFIKYGIRVNPKEWFFFLSGKGDGNEEYPSIFLICYSSVPVMLCLLIEKGLALNIIAHSPGIFFHVVNLIVMVLIPMVVIHVKDSGFSLLTHNGDYTSLPAMDTRASKVTMVFLCETILSYILVGILSWFGAIYVCMLYAVLFLKLWSYVQVNMWCRTRETRNSTSHGKMRRQSFSYSNFKSSLEHNEHEFDDLSPHDDDDDKIKTPLVQYPDNLHIRDLIYYILAPTLCYELNFPRTERIRKRFLVKRIFEVFVGCQVIMSLCQQWMIPSVKNSLIPFTNMDVAKASERLLKLAIPNHLMWLCFFYLFFHSYLNLMGELLYFADRNFYCDWWNANNIDIFWRTWNMVVHRWAVRHLYIPVVEMGYGKTTASVIVFFISAFFHEYLVSVPLKTFKIWAFTGMMGQIPLSYVSKWVESRFGARWGNIVVWSSLIIGQPLCLMVYYHDYVITHFGEILVEDYSTV